MAMHGSLGWECGCIHMVGSFSSWHGSDSLVTSHACDHDRKFSRTCPEVIELYSPIYGTFSIMDFSDAR
jgi:hypothetical protein